VIQSELFDDDLPEIKKAINAVGWKYNVVDKVDDEDPYSVTNEDDLTCVLGSVNFCLQAHRTRGDWQPGAILTIENYNCTRYYAYFGEYLLNWDYEILPYGELARKTCGPKFVRPDRGNKIFTGMVFTDEQIHGKHGCLNFTHVRPDELVVAASDKIIDAEYRMIVIGEEVVSGSQYVKDGQIDISGDVPEEVYEYCRKILRETTWRPDIAFVMDIALWGKGFRLIEINAFSSSGLYKCDYNIVIPKIVQVLENKDFW
jgi:hypothetical protein